MYGKVFESMYDGTISSNWYALVTFQQMIVLCESDGTIDMTLHAMHRRTGIPLEIFQQGIKYLEAPDEYSRSEVEEGRRILRIDEHRPWGWTIVNHKKYRDMRTAEERREYNKIKKREARAEKTESQHLSWKSANTDTDTDTNTDTVTTLGTKVPPTVGMVDEYLREQGITGFTAQSFCDHYGANGWFRGKTKIKNWKICVNTWRNQRASTSPRAFGEGLR